MVRPLATVLAFQLVVPSGDAVITKQEHPETAGSSTLAPLNNGLPMSYMR